MKRILVISTVLNLVLAAWLTWLVTKGRPSSQMAAEGGREATNNRAAISSSQAAHSAAPQDDTNFLAQTQASPASLRWPDVESNDPRLYCQNLRALGCPEHIVHALVVAKMSDHYLQAAIPLLRQLGGRYWEKTVTIKTPRNVPETPEENEAKSRMADLQHYRRAAMLEMFGEDSDRPRRDLSGEMRERQAVLSFVHPDKLAAVLEWEARRTESIRAVYRLRLPDDQRQLELDWVQASLDAEGKQLLSRDEWQEYQLRTSRFSYFPGSLYGVDLNQDEMRAMVSIREAHPENPSSPAMDDRIRALLGPERFAHFKRAQDNSFQALYQFTSEMELPEKAAAEAYELKRAIEQAAQQIRSDRELDDASLRQRLTALRAQAEAGLAQHLGPEGLRIYKSRGGWWLGELERIDGPQPD